MGCLLFNEVCPVTANSANRVNAFHILVRVSKVGVEFPSLRWGKQGVYVSPPKICFGEIARPGAAVFDWANHAPVHRHTYAVLEAAPREPADLSARPVQGSECRTTF